MTCYDVSQHAGCQWSVIDHGSASLLVERLKSQFQPKGCALEFEIMARYALEFELRADVAGLLQHAV